MENNINKIVTLNDDKKYVITKQLVYQQETYYLLCEINQQETEPLEDVKIVKETFKDGQRYLTDVMDEKVLKILFDHMEV